MLDLDLINIIVNILLGMNVLGTAIIVILLIITLAFKLDFLKSTLIKLCVFFAITWLLHIAISVLMLTLIPSKDIETIKKGAVKNITPGTIMIENDTIVDSKNFDINIKTKDSETIVSIWDYASQDGDYVQVYIDNKAITDPIELTNSPKYVSIPTNSIMKIKGIQDGGNGISYAIYLPINKETYFNSLQAEDNNTFTITNKTSE